MFRKREELLPSACLNSINLNCGCELTVNSRFLISSRSLEFPEPQSIIWRELITQPALAFPHLLILSTVMSAWVSGEFSPVCCRSTVSTPTGSDYAHCQRHFMCARKETSCFSNSAPFSEPTEAGPEVFPAQQAVRIVKHV